MRVTCDACNKTFKNMNSLYTHRSHFHPKIQSSGVKEEMIECSKSTPPPLEVSTTVDRSTQISVRDECKVRMFDFMWRSFSNDRSIPYRILDVYQIKKRFFDNLHSFFDFKLEAILNNREQMLVSAILDSYNLEESRIILNENLDIFVNILSKANDWLEN